MFFKIGTVRNPTELKQVNALIKLKVLSSEKFALTPWAKFWYHYSHKIHAWIIRDYNKLIYHCDEVLQVFLQNKELKRAHYVHYLQALEHRARTLVHMHNEGEAKEALRALSNEMIHQRKNASTEEFFKWFNASAETELWYYHVFALYADGEKHIAVLEKELKELNKRSGRNYELPTPFCIACIYFGNKKYKKAITWLHKIINVSESEERLDIQVLSRILLLLCIFEMKDWDYLANQWGAVYRFLAKKKRLYKIESILLDCIRQSLKFHSSDQFKKMFQRLRSEIILLKKDYFEKIIFEYFDFEAWLISKTESITFEEAVRNQNKMY